MEELKSRLEDAGVRGVARSAAGDTVEFRRQGVVDLFTLVTSHPEFLRGGMLADRVVGRGAALLAVYGGVSEVFAYVMSESALRVLNAFDVKASYARLQPHIVNRTGDGICPVELLTAEVDSPREAVAVVGRFLSDKGIISNTVTQ